MADVNRLDAMRDGVAKKKAKKQAIKNYNNILLKPGSKRDQAFSFNRNMKAADKIETASYKRGDKDWLSSYGASVDAHNPDYSNKWGKNV